MGRDSCCVSDQFCDSPGNLEEASLPLRLSRCFRCGQPVCKKCSTRRTYFKYGRVRLCNDCQVYLDGDDKVVMRRLHKVAGC